jgi:hypothetical protein
MPPVDGQNQAIGDAMIAETIKAAASNIKNGSFSMPDLDRVFANAKPVSLNLLA